MRKIVLTCLLCSIFIQAKAQTQIFRYNQTGGLTSLDPAYANIRSNVWATSQIYNGLFSFSQTLDLNPELAQEYEISEDGKCYTLKVAPNIYFHDNPCFKGGKGREFVAQDAVYSFKRVLKEGTGSWVFNDKVITNADGTPSDTCFKAIDKYTLRIYLKSRFNIFLQLLATPYCFIVPHEAVEKYGKDFGKNPVGTGAFKFQSWEVGKKLTFVKNERYWEHDYKHHQLPYLDAIEISFEEDRNVEFEEFRKGNLHFLANISKNSFYKIADKKGKLKKDFAQKFSIQKIPYLNTEYIGFYLESNPKDNPLLRVQVRKALAYAIDRQGLLARLRNNVGEPAEEGFVPSALPSFDSTLFNGYAYNLKKAKTILAEAGFPNGKGLPTLILHTYNSDIGIANFLVNSWKKLGVQVRLELNQFATHRSMVGDGKAMMFRGSWLGDYPDAENYLALGYSKNFAPMGPNFFHFKNTEYDKLFEEAQETDNLFTRYDDYLKLDQILMDNVVMIPLYYDEVIQITQLNVSNLDINAMNNLPLKYVQLIQTSKQEKRK
jgi:peptide/nickel transport system substrate-binding protein